MLVAPTKKHQLAALSVLLALVIAIITLSLLVWARPAYAAVKNDAQVAAAAQAYCGDDTPANQAACQEGFKKGYGRNTDATKAQACNGFSTTVSTVGTNRQSPRQACERGYVKGESAREDDVDPPIANPPAGSSGGGSTTPRGDVDTSELNLGKNNKSAGGDTCGNNGGTQVKTKFNFGCLGNAYPGDKLGPIEDFMYSIIRFLSAGVGIVVIISIILAGIKYSSSEGNAEATQAAKNRVKETLIGLFVYIFAFALIQYLVPGGVFN